MPKPVTHPTIQAWLNKLARRIRLEGERIKASEPTATQLRASEAFSLLALADTVQLYPHDCVAAEEWCIYAAQILEVAAGGEAAGGEGDGVAGDEMPRFFQPTKGRA